MTEDAGVDAHGQARREEIRLALAGVASAVLAASAVSPLDARFPQNFGFCLAEQAVMLLPLPFLRARWSVLGGTLLSAAVCTVAFPAWCAWRRETPGWVMFPLCLPGGLAGSLVASLLSRRWGARSSSFVASATVSIVLGALLAGALAAETLI